MGNNEATVNPTYKANWAKTDKFVWVMGTEDTVVWPREGEQWGAMSTVPGEEFKTVNAMKDTRWYTEDTFGLKTADEAGKNHFESFKGEHIRMTETELFSWFDKYFNRSKTLNNVEQRRNCPGLPAIVPNAAPIAPKTRRNQAGAW